MKLQKIFIYSFPHLMKNFIASKKIGNEDPILYCDLCKAVIAEARFFISKISPDKKVRVTTGNTRLTSDGQVKTNSKLIPKVRSEEFLEDLFEEKICDVMADDYIKWFEPKNDENNNQKSQWRIDRVMDFDGKLNTRIDMDYINKGQGDAKEIRQKDPHDRARSMRWYCGSVLEKMEEEVYEVFMAVYPETKKIHANPTFRVCFEQMGWCNKDEAVELFTPKKVKSKTKKDEL